MWRAEDGSQDFRSLARTQDWDSWLGTERQGPVEGAGGSPVMGIEPLAPKNKIPVLRDWFTFIFRLFHHC